MKKYFTVEEANQALPLIEEELKKLQPLKKKIDQKYYQLSLLKKSNHPSVNEQQIFSLEAELDFLLMESQLYLDNIKKMGGQVRDIETGLIDFPSVKNGEEIFLCWKMGEEKVTYWHGVSEGFAGRKKIE
ncbi:MAG: DUF2203 domain-containing protein [Bacillaceae bacterium]|nr:DUF2203 domain-containing protein [Bacillaceae bacterium]